MRAKSNLFDLGYGQKSASKFRHVTFSFDNQKTLSMFSDFAGGDLHSENTSTDRKLGTVRRYQQLLNSHRKFIMQN
jgi:hypothetical protein